MNAFTLSDALCITITHTQPCIRPWVDFYVHVNVGHSSRRWQLNSRDGPPTAEAHCLCELTDRDQTAERRVGTLRTRSGFWALWKDLSRPFRSDGVSHVLCCSGFFVWIMTSSIFLIYAHTTDTSKAEVVFGLVPWCLWKVHATVLNFSLLTNKGKRGLKQLLWKKQETGEQVWKKNWSGDRERRVGWNELERGVTSV